MLQNRLRNRPFCGRFICVFFPQTTVVTRSPLEFPGVVVVILLATMVTRGGLEFFMVVVDVLLLCVFLSTRATVVTRGPLEFSVVVDFFFLTHTTMVTRGPLEFSFFGCNRCCGLSSV